MAQTISNLPKEYPLPKGNDCTGWLGEAFALDQGSGKEPPRARRTERSREMDGPERLTNSHAKASRSPQDASGGSGWEKG
jgi:hypothetical protein